MTQCFASIGFLLLCLALLPATAHPQEMPRPRTLVRAWLADQAERARDVSRVDVQERAEWTIDGPFGVRRLGWVADVSGGPDVDGWHREPRSAHINGRAIPLTRWLELDEQRRSMMGPYAEPATRAVLQLHRLIASMRPTEEAVPEDIDGVPCWRVEMAPRALREAVERYTLWFDRANGLLIRSRALVRAPRTDQPLIITTDYMRLEGFDVPRRRFMEGTLRTRRRLRTYTQLVQYEATFSDYRFIRL